MTTNGPDPSRTDGTSAHADTAGAAQTDATEEAHQDAGTGSRARERAGEAGKALREGIGGAADRMQRSTPARVRDLAGDAAARTRCLTGKAAAWARRNPKAAAGAIAGTVAFGRVLRRRITRRGRR